MPSRSNRRSESSRDRNRRRVLRTVGTLWTGRLLAGCLGGGADTMDGLPDTSDDGNGDGMADTGDPGEAVLEVTGLSPAGWSVSGGVCGAQPGRFDAVVASTGERRHGSSSGVMSPIAEDRRVSDPRVHSSQDSHGRIRAPQDERSESSDGSNLTKSCVSRGCSAQS